MPPPPATARSPVFADNHFYGHHRAPHRYAARCPAIKATKFATGRYRDLRHRLTGESIPAWL